MASIFACDKASATTQTPARRSRGTARHAPGSTLGELQMHADAGPVTARLAQLAALQRMEDGPALQRVEEDEEMLQGRFIQRMEDEEEPMQGKAVAGTLQLEADTSSGGAGTGLPPTLRQGIEQLSNADMSGVNVHYNSPEPANVGAHAFARGTDIHLAAGQERHLPHEAWHVVQQQQGRVKPTTVVAGMPVNDSGSLEREADTMGAKASQMVEKTSRR